MTQRVYMKKFRLALRSSLIIPLAFATAFCCCVVGKAHAATVEASYQRSMAGDQDHSCCQPNKNSHTKKCNCQNIFGTTEKGVLQKWVVGQETNWPPQTTSFVTAIVFSFSEEPSFYLSPPKYSKSTPPIYLLHRVLRL